MRKQSKMRMCLSLLLVVALFTAGCGGDKTTDWETRAQSAQEAGIAYVQNELQPETYTSDNDDLIFLLAQAEALTDEDKAAYIASLTETVENSRDWERVTQWQRIAFAVAACGADPHDIAGMDFLTMALSYDVNDENNAVDLYILNSKLLTLGAFGDVYGDKALTVEKLLAQQNADGAFEDEWGTTLDSTSLALQALAASGLEEDATVSAAIDKAVDYLASQQSDDGSFLYNDTPSLSSTGQVCTALAVLGIDPASDERFAKADTNLWQALVQMYEQELKASEQDADFYGRVQGLMGLVAVDRLHNDMSPSYYSAGMFENITVMIDVGDNTVMIATVVWEDGDTAYSVLRRAAEQAKLPVVVSGSGKRVYVQGIGELHEFDQGPASGWKYAVNDVFPGESCANYAVASGDVVHWVYTIDGDDVENEQ